MLCRTLELEFEQNTNTMDKKRAKRAYPRTFYFMAGIPQNHKAIITFNNQPDVPKEVSIIYRKYTGLSVDVCCCPLFKGFFYGKGTPDF